MGVPIRGTLFDSSLIPNGWEFPAGNVDLNNGHATTYWDGQNYRVSWDNPGMQNLHWTNQGLGPRDPGRHFDPRG